MRHKFLFRAGWKHIFCIPDFENVKSGEGSNWVKKTHRSIKVEWKFIFPWFYNFLSLTLLFIIFHVLNPAGL